MSLNPNTWGWKTAVGWIVTALVVLFFWHPIWGFVISVAQKADKIFP